MIDLVIDGEHLPAREMRGARAIEGIHRDCLFELDLERTRIDLAKLIALFYELPFKRGHVPSCPSTRGRTVTVLNAVAEPSALSRIGMSVRDTVAAATGTAAGAPARGGAACAVCTPASFAAAPRRRPVRVGETSVAATTKPMRIHPARR